jgi:hypothetical protein
MILYMMMIFPGIFFLSLFGMAHNTLLYDFSSLYTTIWAYKYMYKRDMDGNCHKTRMNGETQY